MAVIEPKIKEKPAARNENKIDPKILNLLPCAEIVSGLVK